jgi:lipid II isoglutaminyl synthase (glutamine-hydrolysing)
VEDMVLRLVYLYPLRMNIYGDRGNVRTLQQRAAWRGMNLEVVPAEIGDTPDFAAADLVLVGGGEDHAQRAVADDLRALKGPGLRRAVEDGLPVLAICGGYQLLGAYYRPAEGDDLPGLGILPLHTVHPGVAAQRCTGNVVVSWRGQRLVGFENHGGRTYLDGGMPLGRVEIGYGNNGEDGLEGCVVGAVYGTYLHGPLLPKNPALADHLLTLAVRRRGLPDLPPLDDALEQRAHDAVLARAQEQATRRRSSAKVWLMPRGT